MARHLGERRVDRRVPDRRDRRAPRRRRAARDRRRSRPSAARAARSSSRRSTAPTACRYAVRSARVGGATGRARTFGRTRRRRRPASRTGRRGNTARSPRSRAASASRSRRRSRAATADRPDISRCTWPSRKNDVRTWHVAQLPPSKPARGVANRISPRRALALARAVSRPRASRLRVREEVEVLHVADQRRQLRRRQRRAAELVGHDVAHELGQRRGPAVASVGAGEPHAAQRRRVDRSAIRLSAPARKCAVVRSTLPGRSLTPSIVSVALVAPLGDRRGTTAQRGAPRRPGCAANGTADRPAADRSRRRPSGSDRSRRDRGPACAGSARADGSGSKRRRPGAAAGGGGAAARRSRRRRHGRAVTGGKRAARASARPSQHRRASI